MYRLYPIFEIFTIINMIKIAAGNFTIPHALHLKKFIARNAETAARKVDYKKNWYLWRLDNDYTG